MGLESEARERADLARLRSVLPLPPLRPRALALAPLPWLGLGGAPFLFPPVFPSFSFLVRKSRCVELLWRGLLWAPILAQAIAVRLHKFARALWDRLPLSQEEKLEHLAAPLRHSATPKLNKSLGVVAERVYPRPAKELRQRWRR